MGTCSTHHSMDMEKEPTTTEIIQVFFNVIRYMRSICKWIRTAINKEDTHQNQCRSTLAKETALHKTATAPFMGHPLRTKCASLQDREVQHQLLTPTISNKGHTKGTIRLMDTKAASCYYLYRLC
mmetsp:Transcript_22357/g.51290  ORF Transcript_22357/g.51290 Transcript_22357/m.51290 type:complete len:125 (+) Transcript_22357:1078-1452(+)